jgi:hypothetical protein
MGTVWGDYIVNNSDTWDRLRGQAAIGENVTYKQVIHVIQHHQPINVPIAGAQTFLMNYPQGEQVIIHHTGAKRIGGWFS